jgi:hypothetical protein
MDSPLWVVPDMDSTEIPVLGVGSIVPGCEKGNPDYTIAVVNW